MLLLALDNLIYEKKAAMIGAILTGNGSAMYGVRRGWNMEHDAGQHGVCGERGAAGGEAVQREIDEGPGGAVTMGCTGASPLIMARGHPEWYHRVLSYSGTFVNQQWPWNQRCWAPGTCMRS